MLGSFAADMACWMREPRVSCSHNGRFDSNLALYIEVFSRFNFKGELSQSEGVELKDLMLGKATQALSATSRRDPQVRGSIGSAGALKPSSLKFSYNERDVSLSRQIKMITLNLPSALALSTASRVRASSVPRGSCEIAVQRYWPALEAE